jgi:hypothetical protein
MAADPSNIEPVPADVPARDRGRTTGGADDRGRTADSAEDFERTASSAATSTASAAAGTASCAVGTAEPALRTGALELRGFDAGLLDDPFDLRVRGAGPGAQLTWRARYRDDDGRIWRAMAASCEELGARWVAAKETTGEIAALRSLRPLSVDVRAELPDGRAATRTLTRRFAADGVRSRRWRDGLAATLHVPVTPEPIATVLLDGTAGDAQATVAMLAAPLLASRGVLALAVTGAGGRSSADPLPAARERLAALPGASAEILVLTALDPAAARDAGGEGPDEAEGDAEGRRASDACGGRDMVVLPPNAGARDGGPATAIARAAAWDALLERLGATPRS